LPENYWQLPVPAQGSAPGAWAPLERSLDPASCGTCHPQQYKDWQTSLHSRAVSPGLVGQLITYDVPSATSCLNCHAPLAEQQQAFAQAQHANPVHEPAAGGLASRGIVCAACHVRQHRRYGPPQRDTGFVGPSYPDASHDGVLRSAEFERSLFCAACHQFDQAYAINGKPLENTLVEWQASPAAAQGKHCQSCHMPDRRHLWRGIHDPAMVESGLTAEFPIAQRRARFRLTNTGVGHAFPTYVTPKVWLKGVGLDKQGQPIADTQVAYVVQRRVEFANDVWVERFDTRLLPGESVTLTVSWPSTGRVRFWLEVHPDDFYDHDVFDALLKRHPADSRVATLIKKADQAARASRYRLFETEVSRPKAANENVESGRQQQLERRDIMRPRQAITPAAVDIRD